MEVLSDLGDEALPCLEAALRDKDWQRRQAAAHLLRQKWMVGAGLTDELGPFQPWEASDALLDVSVEALRDDAANNWHAIGLNNACSACAFLGAMNDRADPWLRRAMGSGDRQQSVLAAAAAACGGHTALYEPATAVLIDRLADNGDEYDGAIAAYALFQIGPRVIPALGAHFDDTDGQRRVLSRHIAGSLGSDAPPLDDEDRQTLKALERGAAGDLCRGLKTGSVGNELSELVRRRSPALASVAVTAFP